MDANYVPSLWETCQRLTKSAEWQVTNNAKFSHERSVTWAQYPSRYLLTESGFITGIFRKRIETSLFELIRGDAARFRTETNELSRYFIVAGELFAVIHSNALFEDEDVINLKEVQSSSNFAIEHGFISPSAEDVIDLEHALKLGYEDGVNAYIKHPS